MDMIFTCPVCAEPLIRNENCCICKNGHSYDIAREGYVHLLPSNRMHSREPGDDGVMVSSRRAFLEKGYYSPLADCISQLCSALTRRSPVIIDAGCGEGFYTRAIFDELNREGKSPHVYGVDISKRTVRLASKLCKQASFAVASVFALPFGDACADVLADCFSPLALTEFYRVLKAGACFLYVVPGRRHLWELKELLYESPYENEPKDAEYEGFTVADKKEVNFTFSLDSNEDIKNLFHMTPYCYKTPKEGVMRLDETEYLSVTAEFIIYVYKKD